MKNKIKYYLILFLGICIGISDMTIANAETYNGKIIDGEYIENMYIKKIKPDGSGRYQQGKIIRRSTDGAFVYCLQPFVDVNNDYVYNITTEDYATVLNLTQEQWLRIVLLSYYGYDYGNHTESKWYYITQVLIWRTAEPTANIFFTDTLNGTRNDNLYSKEINEIEELVSKHHKIPNFNINELNMTIGENVILNDINGVLKNYSITKSTNVELNISGNSLTVTATGTGEIDIMLSKSDTKYNTPPIAYYSENTQNVLYVGAYDPVVMRLKGNVSGGKIQITKLDSETNSTIPQGSGTLVGAKYNVIDSNGNVVSTLIIGNDMTAITDNLPLGTYTIKEISAPEGYELDKTNYTVTVNSSDTVNVIVKDNVIKGRIKVVKHDSETKSCKAIGQTTLKGAKFNVIDHNNNVVDTIIIGDDCTATTKYLPYGKYTLKEVIAPNGYHLTTEVKEQFISEKKDYLITVENDVIKNFISILKQYDYVNGNTTFLNAEANITFEIFYPDGTKYGEIKTDKNGYATIEIPYGVWKFHQVNNNTGFEKIYDFYITVDENSEKEQYYNILNNKISAYLQVFKKDSETGKTIAIANTKFKILNTDTNQYVSQYVGGKVYDNFLTDENGTFTTYLKLEAGNYKLLEIESPTGYLISKEGLEFTIGEDTEYNYTTYGAIVVVEFKNTPIKGQIEIFKTGEKFVAEDGALKYQDIKLNGIKFNLYADEDIKSADGNYLYYNKGDLVETLITNEDGYIKSKNLPLGKYYLVEIETKDNFVLDTKEYHFELTEKDNKTAIVYDTYKAFNYLKKGTLEFTKTDYSTSEPIPNVEFNIFTEKDELIYSGKTDGKGKIIVKELAVGKYYIVEVNPIEGYVSSDEKVLFEIKENGEIVKAKMTNKKISSTLKITKDDEDGSLLSGVKFGVYNLEDKLISEHTTDENGYFEVVLEYGKYYFKEISTLDSYVLSDEKIYFDVVEEGAVIEKTITNKFITGTLEFTKMDYSTSEPLPNTIIEIYTDKDELVFFGKTDENGQVIIEELRYGKYYILEKEAPNGYILNNEKIWFEIQEDGKIVKTMMTNEKIKSTIKIHKIDTNGKSMQGVIFGLYDSNNNEIGKYITNEFGEIELELSFGKYMYKELSTLDGFILDETEYYFNVNEDGATIELELINEIVEVPNTYKSNTFITEIISAVLLISGIGIIIYAKKSQK